MYLYYNDTFLILRSNVGRRYFICKRKTHAHTGRIHPDENEFICAPKIKRRRMAHAINVNARVTED